MLKYQHKILFVDDEPDNLKLLERIFRQSHTVFLAETPQAVFSILEEHEISLVVSDQVMPEMTGLELLAKVSERAPQCIRYLLTGIIEGDEIQSAINSDLIFGYILKPFKVAELKVSILRALEFYELRRETLRLRQDWQQAGRETAVLSEIGSALTSGVDVSVVLEHIVKAVCANFNYHCCSIELIDKSTWELYIKASRGFSEEIKKKRLPIEGKGTVCFVGRTGKLAYLPDVTKDDRFVGDNPQTQSQLTIPLRVGDEIIGVLNIESAKFDDFSERDIFLLTSFADKAAGIINQAHLFDLVSRGKAEWECTFDAMADAVFIFDRKRRLRRVNRAGSAMLGRTYDQLLGARCCDLFRDEKRVGCLSERLFAENQRVMDELSFGDNRRQTIFTADPLLDEHKELIGSVLTARAKIENMERPSSAPEQPTGFELFENIGEAVLSLDAEGKIDWANPQAAQLIGDAASINGLPFDLFLTEEARESSLNALRLVFDGDSQSFEATLVSKNGTREMEILASPIVFVEGVRGALLIAREADRHKTSDYVPESERLSALGQLASGVAHDFNNILAAILGRSQLMQKRVQDPELLRNLQVIERAARDGARMAQRIRDFSRPRSNKEESFGSIEVGRLIREAIDVTSPRWKDDDRKSSRKIRVDFKPIKEEIYTHGDASELREVLTNLILNSIDALPQGGLIKLEYGQHQGDAFIKVADNGIGIPEEVQGRIFEPFFTTKGERGTGLGLNVSQSIILDHGGLIEVESSTGQGTAMTITLPLLRPSELDAAASDSAELETAPASKILVVDDEADVRELLADMLNTFGHAVTVAENGLKAIELLRSSEFQLLVTDLGMPDMSGGELAERAKKLRSGMPVILCTGWGESLNSDQIKEGVVDLIISKPFDMEKISQALAQTLCIQPSRK